MHNADQIAIRLLGAPLAELGERERKVAEHVAARKPLARDYFGEGEGSAGFDRRAADAVASFGGSWTFVLLFGGTLLAWVLLNTWLLSQRGATFDPYPYILLNLLLSMLAAIQAPIILMSQNRQSHKDRISAEHDYEVNLKAELEVMLLHEKVDALRDRQWSELLAIQAEQTRLLARLLDVGPTSTP
jgi:uncharacterized membrane protein